MPRKTVNNKRAFLKVERTNKIRVGDLSFFKNVYVALEKQRALFFRWLQKFKKL